MHFKIIESHEYIEMPWKNGGGTSYEILKFPENSQQWEFRLSIAKVEASGAFSIFPGFHRTLILLSGKGMSLSSSASTSAIHINELFKPHHFSGDDQIQATLIEGANLDFNLIWKSDRFDTETTYYDHPVELKSSKDWLIIFNISTMATSILSGKNEKIFKTQHPSIVISITKH